MTQCKVTMVMIKSLMNSNIIECHKTETINKTKVTLFL